jgi:hypothetical protein
MFGAGLIHSLTRGDAPMLEAGLIPTPLKKGELGGFTESQPVPDGISAFAQRISTHPGHL